MLAVIFLPSPACWSQNTAVSRDPQPPSTQDLNKYPGLSAEFARMFEQMQHTVQSPAPRSESHLLPPLPPTTIAYMAIPNYGGVASQTLKIFRQELQKSSVLRDWWQHSQIASSGPKVEGCT